MTAWNEATGMTNHSALMAEVREMDYAALIHVANDCREAIEAMPEGRKAGHYMDTIHYIGMELRRRREAIKPAKAA